MSYSFEHLIVVPIVLPLVSAALMLLLDERRRSLRAAINVLSTLILLGVAVALLRFADTATTNGGGSVGVYLLGNWSAPFGIVLVVDRLSALMLVLTSILALAALLFSIARWHRVGVHFHVLVQFLLLGLNGAFLTGDLFNLFVFFEVLLAASYGLVLHGSGGPRVKAGLHYIAINLATSSLFLIGVSLIYGTTGTLNMAELAARIPSTADGDRMLLEAGAAILGVAFLVKAGMWPLCLWLPGTYAVAPTPVAALFSIMTKVGVYVVLRLWLLLFGGEAGTSAHFGGDLLLTGGIATVVFGSLGVLASQDLARLAGFNVLVSSGTLLAVIAVGDAAVTGGALYYLVSSALAISAFFLLIELVERGRVAGADMLAIPIEAFGDEEEDEEVVVGVAIPATMAILGVSFACCALLLAGLPPLAGFIAKFLLLSALFQPAKIGASVAVGPTAWTLMALLMLSGLAVVIAMMRAGIRVFWVPTESTVPSVRVIEMAPIAALLLLCFALTVQGGPVMRFMQATAQSLHAPQTYVRDVLAAPRVQRPSKEGGL
ncbi:MAG: monovalent cation/H+ antiporter subunit D [Hyphomicrobiaceae bacterium]